MPAGRRVGVGVGAAVVGAAELGLGRPAGEGAGPAPPAVQPDNATAAVVSQAPRHRTAVPAEVAPATGALYGLSRLSSAGRARSIMNSQVSPCASTTSRISAIAAACSGVPPSRDDTAGKTPSTAITA
jgi:hypothetical protein